jgi:hypothetical protein
MIYSIYKLGLFTKFKNWILKNKFPSSPKEVIRIAIDRYKTKLKEVKADLKDTNWSYLFAKYPVCVNPSPVVGFNTLKIATKEEIQNTINTLENVIQNLSIIYSGKIQKEDKDKIEIFLEKATSPLINGGFGIDYLILDCGKKVDFKEILEKEITQLKEINKNNENVTFSYMKTN